jgi:arylsulfatase A-like enzyme
MTGLWPHTLGITNNNIPLRSETKCLPEMIDSSEYQTGYMGKWHLGDELFSQHGFDEWVSIEDGYWRHYSKDSDKKQAKSDYHHFLISRGHKTAGRQFNRKYAASLPFEESKPKFLERKACDFLKRHREEPFILYINFLEPHMPFFGPFDNEHDPADVDLPENFDDPLEENEPLAYRKRREKMIKKYGPDEKRYRELIAKYWGLVTEVDTSVGEIYRKLEDLGLADNTIVVYTSDHGDMMGSHRLVEKSVMYEEAVKIPLLIRVPWMSKKQNMIEGPVSHIDLVPTLLDLMKCQKPQFLQGASLLPLMKGGKAAEDHVFIEWPNIRTVISPDGWKLAIFKGDKCQLFNLTSDPGETTNLYDSGKGDDVIARLTKKIKDWQKKTKDTFEL